jgi:hypothetical protein
VDGSGVRQRHRAGGSEASGLRAERADGAE